MAEEDLCILTRVVGLCVAQSGITVASGEGRYMTIVRGKLGADAGTEREPTITTDHFVRKPIRLAQALRIHLTAISSDGAMVLFSPLGWPAIWCNGAGYFGL